MYVIFIRCDKLTSNNKHKKQSQNNNTEYYCRLNACLLSTLNSVAVTALAGRRCWVSLLSRLRLVRQSRPTEASVMTTVVTQQNERPVSRVTPRLHPFKNLIGFARFAEVVFGLPGGAVAPFAPYWLRQWVAVVVMVEVVVVIVVVVVLAVVTNAL